MPDKEQGNWYNNKELFEQMGSLKDELRETQKQVQKYNHLTDKLSDLTDAVTEQRQICDKVQATKAGRSNVLSLLLTLWPVIISTIFLLLAVFKVAV